MQITNIINKDISYIKPMYHLMHLFCTVPLYDQTSYGYQLIVTSANICLYLPLWLLSLYVIYKDNDNLLLWKFQDVLNTIIYLSRVFLSSSKFHAFRRFIQLFQTIDKRNGRHRMASFALIGRPLFLLMLVQPLIVFAVVFYTQMMSFGFAIALGYLHKDVRYVEGFYATCLLVAFILSIGNRFRELNEVLKECVGERRQYEKLEELSQLYMELNQLVIAFNDAFGWHILIIYGGFVTGLLERVHSFCIIINNYDQAVYYVKVVNKFVMIVHGMFSIFILSLGCHYLSNEARKFGLICNNLIWTIPKDFAIFIQLDILARQSIKHTPKVCAGGMFNVDASVSLKVFSIVTTYTIMLLQMHLVLYSI